MAAPYEVRVLIHQGRELRVELYYDNDMREPWREHDGHGKVSDWRPLASKRPWEKVLDQNGPKARFYNMREARRRALRDGWGLNLHTYMAMTTARRRVPTRKEVAVAAVDQDFAHLKAWVDNDWWWVGVIVSDCETDVEDSLWGFESTDTEGIDEAIDQLAEAIYVPTVKALLTGLT